MVSQNFYTPARAAEMLSISEAEVLILIQESRLKAEYLDNAATYMIAHSDIMEYLKANKDFKRMTQVLSHRVLLIDRNPDFQELIKMELQRKKVQVKVATSEKDVALVVEEFIPDVILVHLAATVRQKDAITASLRLAKEKNKAHLIVFHEHAPAYASNSEQVQKQIANCGADEAISVRGGARELLQAVAKQLGLR